MIHRRLFWKIYLTLLSSLLIVAMLMGGLWWMLGATPQERMGAFRVRLADQLFAELDKPAAGSLEDVIRSMGDRIGTDISLYDTSGTLLASRGTPITAAAQRSPNDQEPHLFVRIALPDGRTALVQLQHPPGERLAAILTAILVVAGGVGFAAFPVTARLTRQLEALRSGMARWSQGAWTRVDESGSDEVAAVARTFNAAAERITALLLSQRALLANASHELRSPLARLRIAVDLWTAHPDPSSRREIIRNLVELDGLVAEILLCSRLDHPGFAVGRIEPVDLLGLAAEEAARTGAVVEGEPVEIAGNETLLRRLVRNLLENAAHHGREPVTITVRAEPGGGARLVVTDEGDGIPATERERIFEPFYRPAGRSDTGGNWGLGLSLVHQIATHHGGEVRCEDGAVRGGCFVVTLAPEPHPAGRAA